MTLVFDYGGVIVDLEPTRCIEAFQRLGLDIRPFLGTYRQGGVFSLFVPLKTFFPYLRAKYLYTKILPPQDTVFLRYGISPPFI